MQQNIFALLPDALLPWYAENKRELPWREDKNPYHIWVSEIMLQQTRVEAVKGYYARFLNALPTVEALAKADDELLHKLWEGLGYYTRVRNLKKAAQTIVNTYGAFPTDYQTIRELAGIGDYTAGAICSIAYNMPTPAVDGNVLRVISRLTDDATPIDNIAYRKQVQAELQKIYPKEAGTFTQALMELGATVCGPNRKPDCKNCPCCEFCLGVKRGTAESLPVKKPKAQRRVEERTVFILSCDGQYAIEKRPAKGLLANLWQFPNVSGKLDIKAAIEAVERMGLKPRDIYRLVEKKHIFTHIEWNMCGVYMSVAETDDVRKWHTLEEIQSSAALPTAFRQFLEDII